ncbi:MAG: hypothetical protein AAB587_01375 [Patescibacteria group bacterium]
MEKEGYMGKLLNFVERIGVKTFNSFSRLGFTEVALGYGDTGGSDYTKVSVAAFFSPKEVRTIEKYRSYHGGMKHGGVESEKHTYSLEEFKSFKSRYKVEMEQGVLITEILERVKKKPSLNSS